jgi:glycosyltransferase XagB
VEKLDVKLVVEADDQETRQAVAVLDLGQPFTVIIAPPIGPRTKPKALNAALPFVYGSYTVVFDAEDVPEPDLSISVGTGPQIGIQKGPLYFAF